MKGAMKVWRFRFEDTNEVVALGGGQPFGPFTSEAEALDALGAEFGFSDPAQGCYVLVEEDAASDDIYTVVLVDHLGSGVPSCFTMTMQAANATAARSTAETSWPKALVAGVFLGAHTELLSGYQSENRYLGDIKNRSIP
jgi:hypothetical protein